MSSILIYQLNISLSTLFLSIHFLKLINNDENCAILYSKSFHISKMFGLLPFSFYNSNFLYLHFGDIEAYPLKLLKTGETKLWLYR